MAKRQEIQDWIEQNQAIEVIDPNQGPEGEAENAEPTLAATS